jgi:hypothetical protein
MRTTGWIAQATATGSRFPDRLRARQLLECLEWGVAEAGESGSAVSRDGLQIRG